MFEREFEQFLIGIYPSKYNDDELIKYIKDNIDTLQIQIEGELSKLSSSQITQILNDCDVMNAKETFRFRRLCERLQDEGNFIMSNFG